jgi:hypothetical protein
MTLRKKLLRTYAKFRTVKFEEVFPRMTLDDVLERLRADTKLVTLLGGPFIFGDISEKASSQRWIAVTRFNIITERFGDVNFERIELALEGRSEAQPVFHDDADWTVIRSIGIAAQAVLEEMGFKWRRTTIGYVNKKQAHDILISFYGNFNPRKQVVDF